MGGDFFVTDILSVQRLRAIARDELLKWSKGTVYPASGSNKYSDISSMAIEEARQKIESLLPGGNIWFTSGPDEAANWAIKGLAAAQRRKGNKSIATSDSTSVFSMPYDPSKATEKLYLVLHLRLSSRMESFSIFMNGLKTFRKITLMPDV